MLIISVLKPHCLGSGESDEPQGSCGLLMIYGRDLFDHFNYVFLLMFSSILVVVPW